MGLILSLPSGLGEWLRSRSWLRVLRGDGVHFKHAQGDLSFEMIRLATWDDADRIADERVATKSASPLVVNTYLPSRVRDVLESRGVSYLDGKGHLHLLWPNGVLHLEEPTSKHAGMERTATLGVHGVRAVQSLLETPQDVLVTGLARTADLSISQTHKVLKLLESEGLVRSTGAGPGTRRTVLDRARLLDWLAQQPAARRRERYLDVSLYARTPERLVHLVSERLASARIDHAVTGGAAALLMNAGPTTLMLASVRIAPQCSLEEAARALDAGLDPRGANIRLVRDTGAVGHVGSSQVRDIRVAPAVRVYLDLLGERRGEDLAHHFREVNLGY